jgi:hypothetical protein
MTTSALSANYVDLVGPAVSAAWLNGVNAAAFPATGLLVAGLPTASTSFGMRFVVTDATATTFASVVVGGGSDSVPVYSDGTNWRIG